MKVRFDGNVRGGLPWQFAPAQGPVDVKIGEQNMIFYKAASQSAASTTGSSHGLSHQAPATATAYHTTNQAMPRPRLSLPCAIG